MGSVITLTTDFGLADAYVGVMKGVILRINPEADIVDICHTIPPQDIRQAAFILNAAFPYYPYHTVHLIVVDPGVGTDRRLVILKTPRAYFVAPDNGVLSYVLEQHSTSSIPDSRRVTVGEDIKAYAITRSEYWLKPVSNTFHGRDILAPVAARLSLGMPAHSLGDNIDTLTAFPIPHPYRRDEAVIGHILHIDHFGNLITNIKPDVLSSAGQSVTIMVGNYTIRGMVNHYAEGEGLVALFGSLGYLEISRPNGNASAFLNSRVGDEIKILING